MILWLVNVLQMYKYLLNCNFLERRWHRFNGL